MTEKVCGAVSGRPGFHQRRALYRRLKAAKFCFTARLFNRLRADCSQRLIVIYLFQAGGRALSRDGRQKSTMCSLKNAADNRHNSATCARFHPRDAAETIHSHMCRLSSAMRDRKMRCSWEKVCAQPKKSRRETHVFHTAATYQKRCAVRDRKWMRCADGKCVLRAACQVILSTRLPR